MRKVQINLATPGLRAAVYGAPNGARLLAVAVALLLPVAGVLAHQYAGASHRYEIAMEALRVRQQALPVQEVSQRTPQLTAEQTVALNNAIMQLNLPWRALRDAVAAATPSSVALLGLEPDAKHRVLHITAEAKSSDDMIGYVEQIQAQEWFTSAALTRHEINDQDPNHPLRFQLDAQWRQP